MTKPKPATTSFRDMKIAEPLLTALDEIGYETPSPIQAQGNSAPFERPGSAGSCAYRNGQDCCVRIAITFTPRYAG